MNYEIKSAREASLQEIFFDRNTNKLSYKDKLGIITIIGGNNTDCESLYKTPVFINYPYTIQPSMLKTCTTVEQSVPSMFPLGAKLEGYKIGGTIGLFGESPADVIYLGTIENLDVEIPWKITGSVDAYDGTFDTEIQSSLANGALVNDNATNLTVGTAKMHLMTDWFSEGADIYLVYEANTESDISATISFEFEFLTYSFNNVEPIFTFM